MRRLQVVLLFGAALLGFSSCTCVQNPYNPSTQTYNSGPGGVSQLNGMTTYLGIIESISGNNLFSPTSTAVPAYTATGGPILISWGGASQTVTSVSAPSPANISTCPIPCANVWLRNGDGIGGPNGNFGPTDGYIRWAGTKGPDPTNDFSSMTMYLVGNQIASGILASRGYHGFIFFARGHGSFYVSLAGDNTGFPYSGYNFYTKGFGSELTGDGQWHQITVLFSEMTQLYGQAADINNVLHNCYGLQFDQQPPLQQDFQLDIDYVRFF